MAGVNKRRKDASSIFYGAIKAVSAYNATRKFLENALRIGVVINKEKTALKKFKNIYVIGGGKAASNMAQAAEEALGSLIREGVVVTKYGHKVKGLSRIRQVEAAHPLPDDNGVKGAKEVIKIAKKAGKGDLVLCLLSGGASALLPCPAEGINLIDKQRTTSLLLKCGATIQEINAVRKHLSSIKGGLLAKEIYPAKILTIIVSDVLGNDISSIASGPTAPDKTTLKDCFGLIKKYGLGKKLPKTVLQRLSQKSAETPKAKDKVFKNVNNKIIADNMLALKAAGKEAERLGYRVIIKDAKMCGDAHKAAVKIANDVKRAAGNGGGVALCLLYGGETTLVVKGRGKGGRNQELALKAALELNGVNGVTILSAGTDGTDGPTDAAGAIVDGKTLLRAKKKRLDARKYLANNDSYNFFKREGGLFKTGPTGTNVMDVVAALIE